MLFRAQKLGGLVGSALGKRAQELSLGRGILRCFHEVVRACFKTSALLSAVCHPKKEMHALRQLLAVSKTTPAGARSVLPSPVALFAGSGVATACEVGARGSCVLAFRRLSFRVADVYHFHGSGNTWQRITPSYFQRALPSLV